MDVTLRCNSLNCRAQLTDRAIVTTCSHIFCDKCANNLQSSDIRICPACQTHLTNPDDAVLTALNPPEDYKTSVLSGLSPSVIMECASRGLNFFQYQLGQEVTYQEFMSRNLTERYKVLDSQMNNVINEANAEITALRDKLSTSLTERKTLEHKNSELAEAFREKSRAQQRLQAMYQKLKGRVSAVAVEDAAAHDVENVIHAMTNSRRTGSQGREAVPQRPKAAYLGGQRGSPTMFSHGRQGSGGRAPLYGSENQENIENMTTSQRERLSPRNFQNRDGGFAYQNSAFGNSGPAGLMQPTPARQPLGSIDPNIGPGPAYLINPGVKVGRQGGGPVHRSTSAVPRNLGHSVLDMR